MKPGVKAYSAAEKADLLERFIHGVQSGKSQREAAEALGMNPSTLMYWRGIVERGEELKDSENSDHAKKPRQKHVEHPLSTKVEAVRLFKSGKRSQAELAAHYKVHVSTIAKWVRDEREGTLQARVIESAPRGQLKLVEERHEPAQEPRARVLRPESVPAHAAQAPAAPAGLSAEQVEIAMLREENARLKRALDAVIASR